MLNKLKYKSLLFVDSETNIFNSQYILLMGIIIDYKY
jgi:hypothetical protein